MMSTEHRYESNKNPGSLGVGWFARWPICNGHAAAQQLWHLTDCVNSEPVIVGSIAGMSYPSCGEFCPGCPTCPMIQCWKDDTATTDEQRTWDAPYNSSAEQDDTVPYMYDICTA